MSMTLTEWWQQLTDDLTRLENKVENSGSEPWVAARLMASEGALLESSLLAAMGRKRIIDSAAPRLGSRIDDPVTDEIQYVPDVHDPEQLLFAIIYYQHLLRYETIDSGHTLFVPAVIEKRPLVRQNALQLKQRIDQYCNDPENTARVRAAFPGLDQQQGETLLDQVNGWLTEKSIEEKLISQFEADANAVINGHQAGSDVSQLFINLDSRLKTKEGILREIAQYKKLVELLKDDSLLAENIDDADYVSLYYPEHAEKWMKLKATIPASGLRTELAVSAARTTISMLRAPAQKIISTIGWTLGWITPQFIADRASSLVETVGNLTDSITPSTTMELRNGLLIKAAEDNISSLATSLNSNEERQISSQDFKDKTSDDITTLAEKVAAIRQIVNIQQCIEKYRAEHTTGLVKFSLLGVFGLITRLMSQSVLRPLIYEKVLLTLEAEKLEEKLADLKGRAERDEAGSALVNNELSTSLREIKANSETIVSSSRYLLFKKDSIAASEELNAVVDAAKNACR